LFVIYLNYFIFIENFLPKILFPVQHDTKSDNSESSLLIKIIDIHQLDPCSNRFEEIYSVDLGFENEWVSNYLIEENLAIKVSRNFFFIIRGGSNNKK
jgi:hypothetical protein